MTATRVCLYDESGEPRGWADTDDTEGCPACSSVGQFHTHPLAVCVHDDGFEHPSDGTLPCPLAAALSESSRLRERIAELEAEVVLLKTPSRVSWPPGLVGSLPQIGCPHGPHRGPEGPNEDIAQCHVCWSPTYSMRPAGGTFGEHADDCSLPVDHPSWCVGGGSGHPPSRKVRG